VSRLRCLAIGVAELVEADDLRIEEGQLAPCEAAHDGLAGGLLPPRLGLSVVHHQVAVAQLAGRAEVEQGAIERALEDERRVAERTEGHHHRDTAKGIVHDLVPGQDGSG
jgi:hypothetical protein